MTRATARRGRGGRRRIVFSFLRVWFGRCRPAFIRQNYTNILSFPKKNHEIAMFEKQFNSFVLYAWLSSMPVCFLTTTMFVFKDNRDNRNNKKNGRNCGMSRGDIQLGQQDYLCCHRFRASLLRHLLKFSLEGCTKRSGRNPGLSPGIMYDRKTVCKTVPCYVATDGEVLPYRQPHRRISPRAAPPVKNAPLSTALQAGL